VVTDYFSNLDIFSQEFLLRTV